MLPGAPMWLPFEEGILHSWMGGLVVSTHCTCTALHCTALGEGDGFQKKLQKMGGGGLALA